MISKTPKPKLCPCGVKFTPRGIQKYHSPGCELKFKTGRVDPDQEINLPFQTLKAMATGIFQDYIKQKYKNEGCYTCPEKKGIFHAGHAFKKELFSGLILNEDACRKQCDHCNIGLDGNVKVFHERLKAELGASEFETLEYFGNRTKDYKWSRVELVDKIELYRSKIKELQVRSNCGPPEYEVIFNTKKWKYDNLQRKKSKTD